MTIAAAYLTSEGVVLGADSTTSITRQTDDGDTAFVQFLNHAQKVYELGPSGAGRYAFATWGSGSFGSVSHRTVAARAAQNLASEPSVSKGKDQFAEIVQPLVDANLGKDEVVGYFFGGVNEEDCTPECYELVFKPKTRVQISGFHIGEARFQGAPEFFTRVFWGYDPRLKEKLKNKLKEKISHVDDLDNIYEQCFAEIGDEFTAAGYRDLPVRMAIDYIHMYLHVTIKAFKFRAGPPLCGGPIEVGFITTDRAFRWATHKSFKSSLNENLGGDDG